MPSRGQITKETGHSEAAANAAKCKVTMRQQDNIDIEIAKISKVKSEKYYTWLRGVIVASSSLLGVLVSLKSGQSSNLVEHRVFLTSIGLIALGILCGSIALYGEVSAWHHLQSSAIQRRKEASSGNKLLSPAYGEPDRIYLACEKVCYVSLALSAISLVCYAGLADAP